MDIKCYMFIGNYITDLNKCLTIFTRHNHFHYLILIAYCVLFYYLAKNMAAWYIIVPKFCGQGNNSILLGL